MLKGWEGSDGYAEALIFREAGKISALGSRVTARQGKKRAKERVQSIFALGDP